MGSRGPAGRWYLRRPRIAQPEMKSAASPRTPIPGPWLTLVASASALNLA